MWGHLFASLPPCKTAGSYTQTEAPGVPVWLWVSGVCAVSARVSHARAGCRAGAGASIYRSPDEVVRSPPLREPHIAVCPLIITPVVCGRVSRRMDTSIGGLEFRFSAIIN